MRRPEMYLGCSSDQREAQIKALGQLISGYALAVHQHQLPNEELRTLAELDGRIFQGLESADSTLEGLLAAMSPDEAWRRICREVSALAISQSVDSGLAGITEVTDALLRDFRERAASRMANRGGADLAVDVFDTPHRIVQQVSSGEAGLRLVYEYPTSSLRLEINHGPPGGAPAGWLSLFESRVPDVRSPDHDVGLADAIEYGLDLLFPPHESLARP